jgi:hypothetical protein
MRHVGSSAAAALVLIIVPLAGCYIDPFASRRHREAAAPAAPSATTRATTKAEAPKPSKLSVPDDLERRAELQRRAWAAVELDGHPKGNEIAKKVSACKAPLKRCLAQSDELMRESRAAVNAGWALLAVDVDLDKAEAFVVRAEEAAAKDGPTRKERLTKEAAEKKAIEADLVTCEKNTTPCNDKCKAGEGTSCVAVGFILAQAKKFEEGKKLFTMACEGGVSVGCDFVRKVDGWRVEDAKKIEDAWSSLQTIGDDLATKRFLHALAQQTFSGPRNALATQRMAQHIAAMTRDDYCPAVNEFLAASNKGELTKRAKEHCENNPPTATGLAGKEVALTAECRAVYATPCPTP